MWTRARIRCAVGLLAASFCSGADYRPPAGLEPAARRPGGTSVLPGGRMIAPLGLHHTTGPGPFGLAVSPDGRTIVTADGGPNRYSLTILQRGDTGWTSRRLAAPRKGEPDAEKDDWRSVFMGLAFDERARTLYASEGNSGRVRVLEMPRAEKIRVYDLNHGGFRDSYSGDLALDARRGLLYVVDQANFRVAIVDLRKHRVVANVKVGRLPFAVALSPDGRRLYVTNVGMFEYRPVPGADPQRAKETGLPFPAFGFPSPEAVKGARRETEAGPVDVPGLGDPNVQESNSLCIVDVATPEKPEVLKFVRTGLPWGPSSAGGSSPSGVAAAEDRIYVSNGHQDTVTVIDSRTHEVVKEIPIRIPGLEAYRGVLPIGMAYHAPSKLLLVAEAGINAVGVIDTRRLVVTAHLPAAWFPTRIAVVGDAVYVSNAKGHGTGPNADLERPLPDSFQASFRRGCVTVFKLPPSEDWAGHTREVFRLNGFLPRKEAAPVYPRELRYVVLIVKENRTFDEVFGDLPPAANGKVRGAPALARFGKRGWTEVERFRLQQTRQPLRNVNVTPNHRAIAERWVFSDNFYADSEVSVDGHHWLAGAYPNAWTESSLMAAYGGQKDFRLNPDAPGRLSFAQSNSSVHPEEIGESGTLWHHLERYGIPFRNFGEGFELAGVDESPGLKPTGARFLTNVPMPDPLYRNTSRNYAQYNMNIPDQYRAAQFIAEIEELFLKPGRELPRFIYIHLPNDHMARPRPQDGYPFTASYVADNDIALGKILAFLSRTPWWKHMAVFITEDDAQGGVDHVDSHRTVFLIASPWAKRNYNYKPNASFPAIQKAIFRILGIPPLHLFDAVAADMAECFTTTPDFAPFDVLSVDPALFDPDKARDPLDPQPSPRLDDPSFLKEQHRR